MDLGFDQYRFAEASAEDVTGAASAWLRQLGSAPFFLFVHYNDPHLPYEAHPEVAQFFGTAQGSRVASGFNDLAGAREGVYSREERSQLQDLYDEEVAYTDYWVGALLDTLGSWELEGRTLVVLMSDHGEEFWEHGGFEHRHTLFNELLHVPLLIRSPGVVPAGVEITEIARAVDVAPTIAAVLEITAPTGWLGVPLFREGQVGVAPTEVFAELVGVAASLRIGIHKLVMPTRPDRPPLLYDLRRDPGETRNLSKDLAGRMRELTEQVRGRIAARPSRFYALLGGDGSEHTYRIALETTGRFERVAGCRLEGEDTLEVVGGGRRIALSGVLGRHLDGTSFIVTPQDADLRCTAWVDGASPPPDLIKLGQAQVSPRTLPLSIAASDSILLSVGEGGPCLWHSREERLALYLWKSDYSGAEGGVLSELDELTVRQLRSLGYVN
jgi:hypothetical protein